MYLNLHGHIVSVVLPLLMDSRRGVDPRASQTRSMHLEFHFSTRFFHRNS